MKKRTEPVDKEKILEVLQRVYDPDYIDRSVLDMGLGTEDNITLKDIEIEVVFDLTVDIEFIFI